MKTPENWFQVFRQSPHDADFFRRVAHYSMLRLKYVIFQILRSPRTVEATTVGKSPSLTDADSNAKKIVYRCCRYPYLGPTARLRRLRALSCAWARASAPAVKTQPDGRHDAFHPGIVVFAAAQGKRGKNSGFRQKAGTPEVFRLSPARRAQVRAALPRPARWAPGRFRRPDARPRRGPA